MPEPKLGSTHDAGISPRKEAARGRGVSPPPPPPCLFPWAADNQFLPVTQGPGPCHRPWGHCRLPPLPGMFTSRATVGPGRDEPGDPRGPPAPPPSAAAGSAGKGSRAAPLFSRLQLRLRKCCQRWGRRAAALHPEDDRRRPGSGRRLGSRAAPTPQQVHGGGSGARVALAHSPGGAQLRGARGALSPGCGAAARGAGAAAAAGGPELSMSVGRLAPVPGLAAAGGLAGAAAGCEPGGASDGGGLAQPPRDLLSAPPPARVLGPASPPPLPSLATGWTRFRAELEDRAPGAALRLLRRRMRRPPPPRPPALWGRPEGPRIQPR